MVHEASIWLEQNGLFLHGASILKHISMLDSRLLDVSINIYKYYIKIWSPHLRMNNNMTIGKGLNSSPAD